MDERLYTIPLGKAYEGPTVKRANRAVTLVREYITKHAKVSNVSISGTLNRYLWKGSRKHPPRNVKIKVIKEGDKALAYLPEEKMEEKKEAKKEEPKKAEEKPKEEKKEAPKEPAKEVKAEEKKPETKEEPKKEEKKEEKPKEAPKEETSKEQKK